MFNSRRAAALMLFLFLAVLSGPSFAQNKDGYWKLVKTEKIRVIDKPLSDKGMKDRVWERRITKSSPGKIKGVENFYFTDGSFKEVVPYEVTWNPPPGSVKPGEVWNTKNSVKSLNPKKSNVDAYFDKAVYYVDDPLKDFRIYYGNVIGVSGAPQKYTFKAPGRDDKGMIILLAAGSIEHTYGGNSDRVKTTSGTVDLYVTDMNGSARKWLRVPLKSQPQARWVQRLKGCSSG